MAQSRHRAKKDVAPKGNFALVVTRPNIACPSRSGCATSLKRDLHRFAPLAHPPPQQQSALRSIEMKVSRRQANIGCLSILAVAIVGILSASHAALAQSSTAMPPHVPLQKAIGQAKTETVPSLIVFNARGASLQGNKLVLNGIAPNSIVFADRPVRAAGHDTTAHIIEDWSKGNDSFAKDPPNATVSVFTKDGSGVKDAVVVLKSPNLEGERLTFDVEVLEGDLNGADGSAAVFIDIIGRPLTPLSFAGAARRMAWRGAYYRGAAIAGAAAVGAAAVGAAAYYHPYGYGYPPPPCGVYPYPPCY
jgi:hypothetical protein